MLKKVGLLIFVLLLITLFGLRYVLEQGKFHIFNTMM